MRTLDLDLIDSLYKTLTDLQIISSVDKAPKYYDEPLFYYYLSKVEEKPLINQERFFIRAENIVCGGLSFTSPEIACLRALGETVERFSLSCFDKRSIKFAKLNQCKNAIDIRFYPIQILSDQEIGWIEGEHVVTHTKYLLPAQQIFLTYSLFKKEPLLDSLISTGAAAGMDTEETIIKGLYEVIERDAVMTRYLTRSSGRHINLKKSTNLAIRKLNAFMERYRLEWHLFDMQVDIGVPVYFSLLIDRTGIGPALTVGSKAHLNAEKGIIASLEEACMSRILARQWMFTNQIAQEETRLPGFHHPHIAFWSKKEHIRYFDWLLKTPYFEESVSQQVENNSDELKTILQRLSKCGYDAYWTDITNSLLTSTKIKVIKVIIPGLQSLYLDDISLEDNQFINDKRLKKALNVHKFELNPVIHPFL